MEFLITQCGREKFRKFCDMMLKDKSFKDTIADVYGKDFKDIEDFNIKLVNLFLAIKKKIKSFHQIMNSLLI